MTPAPKTSKHTHHAICAMPIIPVLLRRVSCTAKMITFLLLDAPLNNALRVSVESLSWRWRRADEDGVHLIVQGVEAMRCRAFLTAKLSAYRSCKTDEKINSPPLHASHLTLTLPLHTSRPSTAHSHTVRIRIMLRITGYLLHSHTTYTLRLANRTIFMRQQ